MAYCVIADVEAIQAGRLQGGKFIDPAPANPPAPAIKGTYPSATQVASFMDGIEDEINNTILISGYRVPVVSNGYLSRCNAMGAAWMAEVVINVSGTADAMKTVDVREKAYYKMLEEIRNNPRVAGAIPAQGMQNNIATSNGVTGYQNPNAPFKIADRNW